MVDTTRLDHLDPVELLDRECERLERFFEGLDVQDWASESRCSGWRTREILAHLAGGDTYHLAGIEDRLDEFFPPALEGGAFDLDSFNEWLLSTRAERSPAELLEEWRGLNRAVRAGFRALGADGRVATLIGPYPARLQAFHVAMHDAIHGDDIGVPVDAAERPRRLAWRMTVCEFGLDEAGRGVEVERAPGTTRVRLGDAEAVLGDLEFVEAVTGRLPAEHPIDPSLREALASF
jgi:uncharacterized protein (TIGR03083 family)